jgi:hypothetical protein
MQGDIYVTFAELRPLLSVQISSDQFIRRNFGGNALTSIPEYLFANVPDLQEMSVLLLTLPMIAVSLVFLPSARLLSNDCAVSW